MSRSDCGFAARTCTTRVLYLAVNASAMYCNTQYARRHYQVDHKRATRYSKQHRYGMAVLTTYRYLLCTYQAASRLPRAPTCHPSTRTAAPTPCTPCTRASCRQRRNGMNCRRGSRYLRDAALTVMSILFFTLYESRCAYCSCLLCCVSRKAKFEVVFIIEGIQGSSHRWRSWPRRPALPNWPLPL